MQAEATQILAKGLGGLLEKPRNPQKTVNLLVGDICSICGGLEPFLAKGASQVGQRASLLKPAIYTHLDISVNVPE